MIERAAATPARRDRVPWSPGTLVTGLAALGLVAAVIGAPYAFDGTILDSEIATQIRATTGLSIATRGRIRFDLVPRPHIVADGLRVRDPGGTLAIDADELRGEVRLLPLLVGRVELVSATLVRPRLTVDLDGGPVRPDSTIGRAMRASKPGDGAADAGAVQRLGTLTLVDGTAMLTSGGHPHGPPFEAINVTIGWPDLNSPAILTGSLVVRKTAADIAVWIAQPSNLMRGDHSALTLSVHSAPLDLAAAGDLVSAGTSNFRGHVSASIPSLPDLLALNEIRVPTPARFANLSLNSDAVIAVGRDGQDTIDLPNLHLDVDDNGYEGTLAYQSGARPLFSGTLACDQLSLAPFLKSMPPLVGPDRHWARAPIGSANGRAVDLDLRISASHMRVASLTVDDAALAVMTRDDRTEVGLIEGTAYGGSVRGRMSVGMTDAGLSLRGAGSFAAIDAATLSWEALGRQLAAGSVSGSVNFESSGATPAALMAGISGWAKAEARDGELSTVDLGRLLRSGASPRAGAAGASWAAGRTPFDALAVGVTMAEGVATIDQGSMRGADATLVLGGQVDIGQRRLDVTATASAPGTPSDRLAFDVAGPFDKVVMVPADPAERASPP